MPKVSDYELDHSDDFRSFEKVRGKKNKNVSGTKPETKKKRREKKVDY